MMDFPVICVDDFYNNPDLVRNYALKQTYFDSPGNYPGKRTALLHELDSHFYDNFCAKVLATCNIKPDYFIRTCFWQVTTVDADKNSAKNMGWIHQDRSVISGVVYLTPGLNKNLGTTLYKMNSEIDEDEEIKNTNIMMNFYSKQQDDGFDEAITINNSKYTETLKIYNNYNRLICFGGKTPHSPSYYYTEGETRLAQVFFLDLSRKVI